MHVVNTFRTSKGPLKFCIDLEADWLLILDEVGGGGGGGESPGRLSNISSITSFFIDFRVIVEGACQDL